MSARPPVPGAPRHDPGSGALPEPDAVGRAHSERLAALVRERLSDAPLPFVDYMTLALHEPGLGYYMAGAPKFGAEGDFVTAPELSPLFGRCLAQSCAQVLETLAEPGILELGAGSGRLAASLLGALPEPVPYTILEPSAELRERQRSLLAASLAPETFANVRWIETLPERVGGVVLANEVMDALPVERFVRLDGRTWQVCVGVDEAGEGFVDVLRDAPDELASAVVDIETDLGRALPDDYAAELCPSLGPWVASLAERLEAGVLLLADYGYPRRELYHEERRGGTLACYYRHRAHGDPYLWPGLQDITAHVDFTRAAEAATRAGLELLGYAAQSAVLLDCGLVELAEAERARLEREPERIALARAVRTLTLPGEMGERFQFIAFGRGYDRALRGFGLQDLTHRL